ncbi:MAG: HAD family phosphatase [Deltaproteobacteria bacterium]|nr:HAD family phosphatase [Deltaproteobacteria bacterium]
MNPSPPGPRRFKLALFDLDGTLTRERSAWEYIHRRLGVWEGNAERYQEAFLRGEIDYYRFCELDAAVWKGMKVPAVMRILREIPLYEGIEGLVDYLKSRGVKLGIISSGLSLLSDWMREKYGFDYAVANELGMTDGVLDGTIRIHVHYDQKAKWVQEARRRFNARKEEILAVGDSAGDITLFQTAGFSIAFNSRSPRLDEIAHLSIRSSDLRDLIPSLIPHLGPPIGDCGIRNAD